jgi:o-succinylbenzoate synthase
MKLDRIEVMQASVPLKEPFVTSFGYIREQLAIIVRMESDGAVGWGESCPWWAPIYSSEMSATVYVVLQEILGPAVIGRDFSTPADILGAMSFVRGNQFAKAALETAFWSLLAETRQMPLNRLLGGVRDRVVGGVSVGIQESPAALVRVVGEFLDIGYPRVKLKVKPGSDIEYVRAVRQAFPEIPLMVDANSAYSLADVEHLKRFDEFNLIMIEQPLYYDDILDHSKLQPQIETPICLDESIHTPADARQAIELKSGKIINIKWGRLGGFANAIAVHDLCQAAGWPVWIGGMAELGIGRSFSVELASLPNVTLPNDLSPSSRSYAEDIVEPPVTMNPDGTLSVSQGVGIGRRVREQFLRKHVQRSFELRA